MLNTIGAVTKSTFEKGPESHKLFMEFEASGTIHKGQPVVLHSDGDKVQAATSENTEEQIIGISIHEGSSIYGDYVTISMRGYAVIWAKAIEAIVPGPIVFAGYDTADAYSGNQKEFAGYNLVGDASGTQKKKETITVSGTSGTATITVGGLAKTATFDTDIATTISNFFTANAAAYAALGIILTYTATTLVFEGAIAGKDFTDATAANATGDLAGAVAHTTTLNVKKVDTLTLTGTSGTGTILAGGVSKVAEFDTDLTTTAAAFVTANAAAYLAAGIVLTSSGADLIFTANVAGTPFTSPTFTNISGTLAGTVVNTTANVFAGELGKAIGWAIDAASADGSIIRVVIKD